MKILFALISLMAVSCGSAGQPRGCDFGLQPISSPPPQFSMVTENSFEGSITVRAFINASGYVERASVVDSELIPVGNGRAQPHGYDRAVEEAIQYWRFPQVEYACFKDIEIRIAPAR